jgi:hypothetical protein
MGRVFPGLFCIFESCCICILFYTTFASFFFGRVFFLLIPISSVVGDFGYLAFYTGLVGWEQRPRKMKPFRAVCCIVVHSNESCHTVLFRPLFMLGRFFFGIGTINL